VNEESPSGSTPGQDEPTAATSTLPPEAGAAPSATAAGGGSVGKGVLIGFLLQLVLIPVAPLALGIAIVQLAYIGPAVYYFRRQNEPATVKGLWIAASIVALLNAGCWGILIILLSSADFR
jgi:hypothetical protein